MNNDENRNDKSLFDKLFDIGLFLFIVILVVLLIHFQKETDRLIREDTNTYTLQQILDGEIFD